MRARINAVVLVLVSLGLFAWAGWSYHQSFSGPTVQAVVDHCETHGYGRHRHTTCTGHWDQNGQRATGEIEGAGSGDEGSTLKAHVHGDTAYAESMVLPIVAGVIGLVLLIAAGVWGVAGMRRSGAVAMTPPQGIPPAPYGQQGYGPPPPGYGPPPAHNPPPPGYRPPPGNHPPPAYGPPPPGYGPPPRR